MLVTIGAYSICDGTLSGGVAIGQARYHVDRTVEIVAELGSKNPISIDRTNRRVTFTFTVERVHASASAAEDFVADLDVSLPSSGTVTLTPTGGSGLRYIPNGRIMNHESEIMGAKTTT